MHGILSGDGTDNGPLGKETNSRCRQHELGTQRHAVVSVGGRKVDSIPGFTRFA